MKERADGVSIERNADVSWITLSRPERLNGIDSRMLQLIEAEIAWLRDSKDASHVVVLRGEGRAFSAGADLEHMSKIVGIREEHTPFLEALRRVTVGLEQLQQPVVVQVQGYALAGGFELMLAADIIIAGESSRLGDQHAQLGFVPGGGSTQRLPRMMSRVQARDLLITGRIVEASEALAMGLVSRVVPDDELEAAVESLAIELAERDPEALRRIKTLISASETLDYSDGLTMELNACVEHGVAGRSADGIDRAKK